MAKRVTVQRTSGFPKFPLVCCRFFVILAAGVLMSLSNGVEAAETAERLINTAAFC